MFSKIVLFLAIIILSLSFDLSAQVPIKDASQDKSLDAAKREEIINAVLKRLNAQYVFPQTAKKMESMIREKAAEKQYDSITNPAAFAQKLTEDLQSVSRDKHLRVLFDPRGFPNRENPRMTEEEFTEFREFAARQNFGFERVERLQGNVGYIDVRRFFFAEMSGDAIAAAMNFVANTDALIIDLRQHRGGEPETVVLFASYFFDEATHFNDIYWREGDRTQQFWTSPHVAGTPYLNKPVFILTGKDTFSGAEGFAYGLKTLKRATVIGETTGGGAHPAPVFRLTDFFGMQIPIARAISPVTKTNWEGTGIEPDIKMPAATALKTAHTAAVREILRRSQDPQVKSALNNLIEKLQGEK